MNEELIREESQGEVVEYKKEEIEEEGYMSSRDILRCFIFYELISKPISLRR